MVSDDGEPPDWLPPDETVHVPQNAFVLVGEEETLLLDTLSPASTAEILDGLEAVLGDRELDYVVVSHPDVPHAGNSMAILEAYPAATLVGPEYGTGHEHYHLADAHLVGEGDSIDLGGLVAAFHEATFLDSALSIWMTEREHGALFPIDWLGFPHLGSETLRFVDEIDGEVGVERLLQFHGRVVFWLQYVDVEKTCAEIDRVRETFDPEIVGPAHGLVVREDADRYLDLMKPVVERIDEEGRVGTFG